MQGRMARIRVPVLWWQSEVGQEEGGDHKYCPWSCRHHLQHYYYCIVFTVFVFPLFVNGDYYDCVQVNLTSGVLILVGPIPSTHRLTEESGLIHDGIGNYSIGVKCSWLIDARQHYADKQRSNNNNNNMSNGHHHRRNNHLGSHHAEPPEIPLIRIHLEEFATECGWDHLYVYDGDSVESPLLAVFR